MVRHATNSSSSRAASLRQRLTRLVLLTLMLSFAAIGSLTPGRAEGLPPIPVDVDPAVMAKCKADLAQRFTVQASNIHVLEVQEMTWPDASLGMPKPDTMYAQVQTAGWTIVLEARNSAYLYTASATACQYGGPVPLWSASMLYLVAVPNEPNLNGDLYQCSLLGTHCRRLASGVSAYYPQADGVVLFTQRTSRSSYDLLVLNTSNAEKVTKLYTAFAIGEAAMNAAQDTWAAYTRPRVGATWEITVAHVGQGNAKPKTLALPEGVQAGQIAWSGEKLMILATQGEKQVCFETTPAAEKPEWTAVAVHTFPGVISYLLNKSEHLEVTEITKDGRPSVEVARVWFTGDRNVKATISGLTLRGHTLLTLREYDFTPGRFLVIWGEQDGRAAAYTVDIVTGEVIPGFQGAGRDVKPFACPLPSVPYRVVMRD